MKCWPLPSTTTRVWNCSGNKLTDEPLANSFRCSFIRSFNENGLSSLALSSFASSGCPGKLSEMTRWWTRLFHRLRIFYRLWVGPFDTLPTRKTFEKIEIIRLVEADSFHLRCSDNALGRSRRVKQEKSVEIRISGHILLCVTRTGLAY